MSKARIYIPCKTAMQSGKRKQKNWVLEYCPACEKPLDPLMGWTMSSDTPRQVRIEFSSQKEAEAFAKAQNISYEIIQPQSRKIAPKSYGDNFSPDRIR